jgi:hypothetical protein
LGLVVQVVLVVELEPVAAVVPLILAVRVAVAPVLAIVVVEYWRSEPSSVVAGSQVAPP